MKRVEISYRSNMNELYKLNARLERAEKVYTKRLANAEKLGVAEMTDDEHREWLASVPTENGWIINKEDIKKNGAWFDLLSARNNLEDVKRQIENAEKRLQKVEEELTAYREELAQVADLQEKGKLMALEFENEQKEWKKDGIDLKGRYYGTTPSGKKFSVYGNCGYTLRSRHCFTLRIDGETIFTSGEFWRAYGVIKNS